ncbi:MAG: Crp/Fnr family transcriptional regulator [Lachnospiraceae bacterium]|nr:Crp/Fnr family transcriptional regulator [Lachnospiraceae bacterium]
MKEFFPVLRNCSLFDGIEDENLSGLLACLGAKVTAYHKHQTIVREGEPAKYVGILLTGAAQLVREDYYGNRSIMARIEPTDLFGESFACAGIPALPVSVAASEDCQVMLIDCRRITMSCTNACAFHSRMIYNLLQVVSKKNLAFHQKLEILSQRTTREKLMTYLLAQAKLHHSNTFTIPYDRQSLADYLGVERSAMSAEISKLRRDGVIACEKSTFRLL